jgi:endonuclease/exonuclease/phosphatase family metal-dependent hydrolase
MRLKLAIQQLSLSVVALLLMLLQMASNPASAVESVSFSVVKGTYSTSETIEVNFSHGSGSNSDWFGIYPAGVQPGAQNATDWKYVNNTRTSSAAGITGQVTFASNMLTPGQYSLWFLGNNGYTPLAQAVNFAVTGVADQPKLSVKKSELAIGEPLALEFSNPNAASTDWLGVYAKGVTPGPGSVAWVYMNGTKTATNAVQQGAVSIPLSLAAGSYDLWLLANDGYTTKAGPVTFHIKDNRPLAWMSPKFRVYQAVSGQNYQLKLAAFLRKNSSETSFTLVSAPSWLTLSDDGMLQGMPTQTDVGAQQLVVRANDLAQQTSVDAIVELSVLTPLQQELSPIRVMTYNVWRAFGQVNQGYQKGLESILHSKADIIGLQEANVALAAKLAGDLGWHHAVGAFGGIQIISRFPVIDKTNIDFSLVAKIKLPYTDPLSLWVANTHLDPHYYGPYAAELAAATPQSVLLEEQRSERLPQIKALLAGLQPMIAGSPETPFMLLGDFNVPSHLDWTAATAAKRNGVGPVVWSTSDAVAKAGFIDSYRHIHPDPLLQPGDTWSPVFKGTEPQDRIDRIYWQGRAVKPVAAATFKTAVEVSIGREGSSITPVANNTWPSDHAAVVTDMSLRYHPADFDKNGQINQRDISLFRQRLTQPGLPQIYDFNNDGAVNQLDIRAMMVLCQQPRCMPL